MRNRRFAVLTILSGALLVTGAFAAPLRGAGHPSAGVAPAVADYVPQIDGPMSTVAAPDGSLWAVWSYRASGEYDIAIASLSAAGTWGEPTFFGRRDGVDEIAPALAVDGSGRLHLVYATRQSAGLSYATFSPATDAWTAPTRLSADKSANAPAIHVVSDRVVVAWNTASGVVIVDFPAAPPGLATLGIHDGPDSVDPLGIIGPTSGPGGGSGNGVGVIPGGAGGGSSGGGGNHDK